MSAIAAGIENDLGSGSNIDVCVITAQRGLEHQRGAWKEPSLSADGFGHLPEGKFSHVGQVRSLVHYTEFFWTSISLIYKICESLVLLHVGSSTICMVEHIFHGWDLCDRVRALTFFTVGSVDTVLAQTSRRFCLSASTMTLLRTALPSPGHFRPALYHCF